MPRLPLFFGSVSVDRNGDCSPGNSSASVRFAKSAPPTASWPGLSAVLVAAALLTFAEAAISSKQAHADPIISQWTFRYRDADNVLHLVRLGQTTVFDQEPDGSNTFRQVGPFGVSGPFPYIDTGTGGVASATVDNFEVGGLDLQGRIEAHAEIGTGATKQVITVRGPSATSDPQGDPLPGAFRTGESAVQPNVPGNFAMPVVTDLPGNATATGRAFAIFDSMVTGVRYADHLGSNGMNVNVIDSAAGTFTKIDSSNLYRVFVTNADAFDWDIMLHEFGHVVSTNNKFDDSPGGSHGFNEVIGDTNAMGGARNGKKLAWSEGFANYFQAAAQDWENGLAGADRLPDVKERAGGPSIRDTITTYLDEVDQNVEWNIEARNTLKTNGMAQAERLGPRNELAIARILWDLMDGTGGSEGPVDQVTLGSKQVFELAKQVVNPADAPAAQHGAYTLEDFEKTVLNSTPDNRRKTQIGAVFAEHGAAPRALRAVVGGGPPAPPPSPVLLASVLGTRGLQDGTGVKQVPGGVILGLDPLNDPASDFTIPVFGAGQRPTFEWLATFDPDNSAERYQLQFFQEFGRECIALRYVG